MGFSFREHKEPSQCNQSPEHEHDHLGRGECFPFSKIHQATNHTTDDPVALVDRHHIERVKVLQTIVQKGDLCQQRDCHGTKYQHRLDVVDVTPTNSVLEKLHHTLCKKNTLSTSNTSKPGVADHLCEFLGGSRGKNISLSSLQKTVMSSKKNGHCNAVYCHASFVIQSFQLFQRVVYFGVACKDNCNRRAAHDKADGQNVDSCILFI
mmetsp:Transcript_17271/g.30437  ORF Transcript_17271/g.30437 Transcript_17271/m.30437 type:complete len:208 (+) Transcript_17271:311-934(+)